MTDCAILKFRWVERVDCKRGKNCRFENDRKCTWNKKHGCTEVSGGRRRLVNLVKGGGGKKLEQVECKLSRNQMHKRENFGTRLMKRDLHMEQVNSARRPIKASFWSWENMGGSVWSGAGTALG